jgi:soluble lytic murein transglycosylase-like protein
MKTSAVAWGAVAATHIAVAALAGAAEPALDASSVYRLNIAPEAYRLTSIAARGARLGAGEAAAPEPSPPPEPPAQAPLPAVDRFADKPFARQIAEAAQAAALDLALVHAVIFIESRYDPKARSPKGAVGLMQVLPETALRYGISDPARSLEDNLKAGTRYLSDLVQLFAGRLDLALAAYNAGEKAVQRHGLRIPPYAETRAYVPAVLAKYREWRARRFHD